MPISPCTERAADGGPILVDGERIIVSQPQVACLFDVEDAEVAGTLHVTTHFVYWFNAENPLHGLRMDYPTIVMHAVSRDPGAYVMWAGWMCIMCDCLYACPPSLLRARIMDNM